MKTAVIFGVTGQDGSYLAELLLSKNYYVVGVSRRVSSRNDERIRHLLGNPKFEVVAGDVTDPFSVQRTLSRGVNFGQDTFDPLEVYNLAAQSHVGVSFNEPVHTTSVTYLGCLNILEAMRSCRYISKKARFYQASSSEMFGSCHVVKFKDGQLWEGQDENTPLSPNSPYAIAKVVAHHAVRMYRAAYGLFSCSGILFNHESPRRSEDFVTRKITKYISKYKYAKRHDEIVEPLRLGNLQAKRDWGHARDYVAAMWPTVAFDELVKEMVMSDVSKMWDDDK